MIRGGGRGRWTPRGRLTGFGLCRALLSFGVCALIVGCGSSVQSQAPCVKGSREGAQSDQTGLPNAFSADSGSGTSDCSYMPPEVRQKILELEERVVRQNDEIDRFTALVESQSELIQALFVTVHEQYETIDCVYDQYEHAQLQVQQLLELTSRCPIPVVRQDAPKDQVAP